MTVGRLNHNPKSHLLGTKLFLPETKATVISIGRRFRHSDTIVKDIRESCGLFGQTADVTAQDVHTYFCTVEAMDDQEAIKALCSLKGIGVWTAEMILLFCLQRPNILSYGDLAILRGMRMVYRHRKITRDQFERVRRRLSPCGNVASLYFWAVAGGALPDVTDPGAKK